MYAAGLAGREHDARDVRRPRSRAAGRTCAPTSGPIARILDLDVAHAELHAAAAGEHRVRLEALEALDERGRRRDPADERAAALAADDLAALLEALERACAACRARRRASPRGRARAAGGRPAGGGRGRASCAAPPRRCRPATACARRARRLSHDLLGDRERVLARGRRSADGLGGALSRGSTLPARLISTSRAAARDAPSASIAARHRVALRGGGCRRAPSRPRARRRGRPPRPSRAGPPRRPTGAASARRALGWLLGHPHRQDHGLVDLGVGLPELEQAAAQDLRLAADVGHLVVDAGVLGPGEREARRPSRRGPPRRRPPTPRSIHRPAPAAERHGVEQVVQRLVGERPQVPQRRTLEEPDRPSSASMSTFGAAGSCRAPASG